MAKETAEQKLLKALQKKSTTTVSSSTNKKNNSSKGFKFAFSILDLNKILLLGIVICVVVLILQLKTGAQLLSKDLEVSDDVKVTAKQDQVSMPQSKDVKYYIDSMGNRNIFKPYDISLGKAAKDVPTLAKRLKKYKLVGVAWLDLPQSASVMIEDTEAKTTNFYKIGDKLEGVTIKTIYTDRVVLSYENEETTIKL